MEIGLEFTASQLVRIIEFLSDHGASKSIFDQDDCSDYMNKTSNGFK